MTISTKQVPKNSRLTIKRRHEFTSLPNLLTYLRMVLVPVMFGCFFLEGILAHILVLGIFSFSSITDIFDGVIARRQKNVSSFGRVLDPVADKLLVSATLLLLIAWDIITGWSLFAALVILTREILVSGLREYLAQLKVSIPVSMLSKLKTVLQILALGFLIGTPIGPLIYIPSEEIGLVLLWCAAIITLWTGLDYFRKGIVHFAE